MVCETCPAPVDAVIPIVYFNQPITIPFSEVDNQIPDISRIDVNASMRSTFTVTDSDPPVEIVMETPSALKVSGLGHAGVAFINGSTGECLYYEYGRYDAANFGLVRSVSAVSNITINFEETGNPSLSSFENLTRSLVATNGPSRPFNAVYIKLEIGSFDVMKAFCDARISEITSREAQAYSVANNHCFTFALEVAEQVGVNVNVAEAPDLELRLEGGHILTRIAILAMAPSFEVPARQMRVMQRRYTALNVDPSGSIQSSFSFP